MNVSIPDTPLTYTATADCFISGDIGLKADGTNYVTGTIAINSNVLFSASTRAPYYNVYPLSPIALKAGDVVTIGQSHSVGYTSGSASITLHLFA